MVLDQYTGLYFFSALFQGDIAFLALSGVFIVYRLQLLSQEISSKDSELAKLISRPFEQRIQTVPEPVISALEDIRHVIDRLNDYYKTLDEKAYWRNIPYSLAADRQIQFRVQQRNKLDDKRAFISKEAGYPVAWMVFIVLVTLIALPIASLIHGAGVLIECIVLGAVVLLNAYAIVINAKFSLTLMRNS
jgi:hypothetical protein